MTAPIADAAPTDSSGFRSALAEWRAALGDGHVRHDDSTLDRYARCTLPRGTRARAVLSPGSTEEVRAVVRVAAERGIALHPISRGKNWGYGDACAVTDGQVVVELSRMDRIVEVNPTLAYAVVEPGVTQGQLYSHLRERELPLWLDCTGAGPDASIVGNVLERGFGHTPYGDHMRSVCSMEIVLSDGRVLRTGFGHYENAQSACVFPYGIGPWLDGLFTQSNFGIVTRMVVWLLPEPAHFNAFFLRARRDDAIGPLIDALRALKLRGVLQSAVHVGNDLRSLSAVQHYPYDLTGGRTPLPDDVRSELRRTLGIGAWNVAGGLYGARAQVAAGRKAIRKALRRFGRVLFLGDAKFGLAALGVSMLNKIGLGRGLGKMLAVAQSARALLRGEPDEGWFHGALWRVRGDVQSLDPLDNDCGLMWISPVLPMTGQAARDLLELAEPIYAEHGFEFMITLTLATPRALCCVMSISYDRLDADETERAAACYENLFDAVMARGYVPYRTGIRSMAKLRAGSSVFWDVVRDIKDVLDPKDVISPGRYAP